MEVERAKTQDDIKQGEQPFEQGAQALSSHFGKKAVNEIKKAAKEAAKKTAEKQAAKLAASKSIGTIAGWVASAGSGLIGAYIVPIVLIFLLITIIPFSLFLLLSAGTTVKTDQELIEESITYAYGNKIQGEGITASIVAELNVQYGCKNFDSPTGLSGTPGTIDDIKLVDATTNPHLYYQTDTCEIDVYFTPTAQFLSKKTSAYVNAVNGVLDYYGKPEDVDGHMIVNEEASEDAPLYEKYSYDTSGMPDINNSENFVIATGKTDENGLPEYEQSANVADAAKETYNSNKNHPRKKIENYSNYVNYNWNEVISLEADPTKPFDKFFKGVNTHKETREREDIVGCGRTQVSTVIKNGKATVTEKQVSMPQSYCSSGKNDDAIEIIDMVPYKVTIGEVTVNEIVGVDPTEYRKSELEGLVDSESENTIVGKGRCYLNTSSSGDIEGTDTCTEAEANRVVNSLLMTYYKSSFAMNNEETTIRSFAELLGLNMTAATGVGKTGTLKYPASAKYFITLSHMSEDDRGFSGSVNTPEAVQMWNHQKDLQGLIHGASNDYQCTDYAQMWFYDMYHENSSGNENSGNGNTFASVVYDTWTYEDEQGETKHYFEYADAPSAGGLISVDYFLTSGQKKYGHIVCCDAVDYEGGYIWISDGNYDGAGGVRIRRRYTLEEFYSMYAANLIFVNPTSKWLEEKGIKIEK